MSGTCAACLHTNQSQSYLNHLVLLIYHRRKLLDLILIRIAGLRYGIRTRNFPEYERSVPATKQCVHVALERKVYSSGYTTWLCNMSVLEMVLSDDYIAVHASEGGGASRPTIHLFDEFHQSVLATWWYRGPRRHALNALLQSCAGEGT
jgi:hypothetical protein